MQTEFLPGPGGYPIPCQHNLRGDEQLVALICHGLGSSMRSGTLLALREALAVHGAGALGLDLPAHGQSPVDGESLRVPGCLDDIAAAEAHIRALAPKARIVYFGSSFGAYLTLLYLATRPHAGERAFLRCAAVDLPELFAAGVAPRQDELARQGYLIFDEGYLRPLKITPPFLADLAENDVFTRYRPGMAQLAMVHGDADTTVPLASAQRFAAYAGAPLTVLPGEDHSLSSPQAVSTVLRLALAFFGLN